MAGITQAVLSLSTPWAYLAVGSLALLEASAFVGLVIPGELAMLLGGFIAYQGRANVWVMVVAGVLGAVAGDSIGYELGRVVGPRLRRSRAGRWVGEQRWDRVDAYVKAKGGKAIFGGRFVGVLRAMVPTVAGVVGMPYRRFLLWNALGAVVWAPSLILTGYLVGASYVKVERVVARGSLAGAVALAAVAVALVGLGVLRRGRATTGGPDAGQQLGGDGDDGQARSRSGAEGADRSGDSVELPSLLSTVSDAEASGEGAVSQGR